MYLTRFEFNTARRGSRELLASPHRLHGAVQAAFPTDRREARPEGRILWRVDQREHRALLYLVSPYEPDLTHVVEVAGWPTTEAWQTKPYRPLLEKLDVGQEWAFRLTANPVYQTKLDPTAKRSKRLGHVTVRQQTEWLLTRCERLGFRIMPAVGGEPDVAVQGRRVWTFRRDSRDVTLATATFGGRLAIEDAEAFRHSLTHGIGPAKGYGCGLLTLAR
ncbi:type I-E CRISPR-associated protein Cas6/Cse3/CasE [Actinokineospora enzanensis]|uniref:type I-E CRISPR-associated protein Cas6/Cse3/CasE n=1 Tax=Actinokineospora enzanensis TaxID=155975 RepID=UPI00037B61D3|nr:type I-E CRISPR-associated protein Cas6/Cse3/CasE [Actinokineospora enzanensis]